MMILNSDAKIYLHIHSDDVDGQTLESLAHSLEELIRALTAVLLLLQAALNVARELFNMPIEMVHIGAWLVRQAVLMVAYWLTAILLQRVRFQVVA